MTDMECTGFSIISQRMLSILQPKPKRSLQCVPRPEDWILGGRENFSPAVALSRDVLYSKVSTYCRQDRSGSFATAPPLKKERISSRKNGRLKIRWNQSHTMRRCEVFFREIFHGISKGVSQLACP